MIQILCLALSVVQVDSSSIEVSITPKKGEPIVGTTTATFDLTTTFGSARIDGSKLSEIQFGSPTVVTTTDNTVLRGNFEFDSLTIKTKDGNKNLTVGDLKKLQVIQRAKPIPGQVSNGRSANGMTYHLRVPPGFAPDKLAPAIIILHGSNMNSLAYVDSITKTWPDIAKKYILIGINGERRNANSKPNNPSYNYTYVNFVGKRSKYKGYPGTHRESPALVKEVVEELRGYLPIERLFIGGHSQGGFLTYTTFMNFPELFDGAFPISSGMIVQAEPKAFEKEDVCKAQRERPIAIVHGTSDRSVKYSMSTYALDKFYEHDFPMARLFDHKTAGHRFIFLPVDQAVQWLEEMSSRDPKELVSTASRRVDAESFRDALALLGRAGSLPGADKKMTADLRQKIEDIAKPQAESLLAAINANEDGSWVDDYLQFHRQFAFAKSAKSATEAFAKLRADHQPKAESLYQQSRADFKAGKKDAAYAKYQEVVDKYYASSRYKSMKRWIAERKD